MLLYEDLLGFGVGFFDRTTLFIWALLLLILCHACYTSCLVGAHWLWEFHSMSRQFYGLMLYPFMLSNLYIMTVALDAVSLSNPDAHRFGNNLVWFTQYRANVKQQDTVINIDTVIVSFSTIIASDKPCWNSVGTFSVYGMSCLSI